MPVEMFWRVWRVDYPVSSEVESGAERAVCRFLRLWILVSFLPISDIREIEVRNMPGPFTQKKIISERRGNLISKKE